MFGGVWYFHIVVANCIIAVHRSPSLGQRLKQRAVPLLQTAKEHQVHGTQATQIPMRSETQLLASTGGHLAFNHESNMVLRPRLMQICLHDYRNVLNQLLLCLNTSSGCHTSVS